MSKYNNKNQKHEDTFKEGNESFSSEDLSLEDELKVAEVNAEETEGIIEGTPKEVEIVDQEIVDQEIIDEKEFIELLESDKEKDMNKKMKKLQEENAKLENEAMDFKDKLLRTMAEYENFRKRTTKEKEGIYTDACADVLKEVLPVLDNLERALSVEGNGEELRTGVEMTVRQFNDAFNKLGVEELAPEGEFDPNLHNAVMHIEDEKYGTNEIVEVYQKGYKRANKVLRHSMVKVAN